MKFTHILHALHCEPWLITPAFHATLSEILEQHIENQPSAKLADLFANEAPKMSIEDGVATIPIEGVIGRKLSTMEKSCGAVSVEDIEQNICDALADQEVSHIMLSIDSPGGSVGGVPELGAMIARASSQKPTMAYADGLMCSAAYWAGCGAGAIYASDSSVVGSIGVYMAVLDRSRMAEMQGLKVDVIKAGKFKGAGMAGTSLTDDQRGQLQSQVDQIKEMFDAHVSAHRGSVEMKTTAQGQTFMGHAAQKVGLVDQIASKSQALSDLKKHIRVNHG